MKKVSTILVDEVPRAFDDACIKRLVREAKPPKEGDFAQFARSVRGDVRDHALAARKPSPNDVPARSKRSTVRQMETYGQRLPNCRSIIKSRAATRRTM